MIGSLNQFWRLTRELDLNAIRETFEHRTPLAVLGSDRAAADRLVALLGLDAAADDVSSLPLAVWSEAGREARAAWRLLLVAIGGPLEPAAKRVLGDLSVGDVPLVVVQDGAGTDVVVVGVPEERTVVLGTDEPREAQRDRLLDVLVRVAPETLLPLGRRHPDLRAAVARHLILDAARANAQFAAVSSVPAIVPLLGGLMGDAADIFVLTKNQAVLLFKLAGLYGRDLTLGRQLLAEVLPVVGGSFLWRTAARSLAGLLPPVVSVVPKVAVAYSGTFVVGEMARYYYEHGRKPPPDLVRQMSADGLRLARSLTRGPRGRKR